MIERIQKLEKSNRRMKKYMISLHVILVGMLFVGFQSTAIPDVIEARKLLIKGDNREGMIVLEASNGHSSINLYSNYDSTRSSISINSIGHWNDIRLSNKDGELNIINSLNNNIWLKRYDIDSYYSLGNDGVFGRDKDKGFKLSADFHEGTCLNFYETPGLGDNLFAFGKKTITLSSKNGNQNLSLYDEQENKRVSIGNQNMIDQYGNEYKSAVSSIHLFNQNNKTIFKTPR
jgi:hypothetical protein